MDIFAHAVYGATICSRTGLAGGSRGVSERPPSPWISDGTLWLGVIFGVLPDVASMGPAFVAFLRYGSNGNFFRELGPDALTAYRIFHSLVISLGFVLLLRLARSELLVPACAWPLHVVMDAFTHGTGKFQTPIFYPFSTWGFDSARWWEHPRLMLGYWVALPVIWTLLWSWRRAVRKKAARAIQPAAAVPAA